MRADTFLKDRIFRIGRAPPIWWASDRKGAADPERATIVFGGNAMGRKKKNSVMGYKMGLYFPHTVRSGIHRLSADTAGKHYLQQSVRKLYVRP